eukprot:1655581-Karenia_brevis.AAC.1
MISLASGTECQAQEPYFLLYDVNFPKYRENFETSAYSCTWYGRDLQGKECEIPRDDYEDDFELMDEAFSTMSL